MWNQPKESTQACLGSASASLGPPHVPFRRGTARLGQAPLPNWRWRHCCHHVSPRNLPCCGTTVGTVTAAVWDRTRTLGPPLGLPSASRLPPPPPASPRGGVGPAPLSLAWGRSILAPMFSRCASWKTIVPKLLWIKTARESENIVFFRV